MCTISQDFEYEVKSNDDPISLEDRSYELPGGDIIQVGHKLRYNATEILF